MVTTKSKYQELNRYTVIGKGVEMISISVVVLTFNPVLEKIIKTLDSILCQKSVNLQIVISDDGSRNNYFTEIKKYMEEKSFSDYIFLESKENMGTVKNLKRAVEVCKYEYVKDISPGDYLASDSILAEWIKKIINSKSDWSFGEAIYYSEENGERLSVKAHPQIIDCYEKKDYERCIWNYVVLDDIALGAVMICKKKLMLKYLSLVENRVVYAEDNIFRIMMFDGNIPEYIPDVVVMYEYGSGVSTSGSSEWERKLHNDWDMTTQIITDRAKEKWQIKIVSEIKKKNSSYMFVRLMQYFLQKGKLAIRIKQKYCPRMTKVD